MIYTNINRLLKIKFNRCLLIYTCPAERIFAYSSLIWMRGSADRLEKKGYARVI